MLQKVGIVRLGVRYTCNCWVHESYVEDVFTDVNSDEAMKDFAHVLVPLFCFVLVHYSVIIM